MEYQKIANLIDNTSNQPSKFRTRNWVETNDESRWAYNVNTTMLKSSLCDYSDAYILVKGMITINGRGADAAARQADERDKGVSFKNCAPFINCISEINNMQIDNAKDIDIVMPMYNLIEYSDNYAKTSGSLWQYFRDEPDDNIEDSESFKSKIKITGKTPNNNNEKDVEIMVPLKYLSNFWRTLEMPLINCEVNLILTWSSTCVIKYDQPIKDNKATYENIRKIVTGHEDDYTTGCLLDYSYYADTYKMIAVDLSKQQALDADPRAIEQEIQESTLFSKKQKKLF